MCLNLNLWLWIIGELHGNYTLSGTVNINIFGDITHIPTISVRCPGGIRMELVYGTLIESTPEEYSSSPFDSNTDDAFNLHDVRQTSLY
jgi:hypothetical protein